MSEIKKTKLTDKQKKKIIADYINNSNFRETGRMNNVHASTVKRLVESNYDKELQKKATQKKEQNTKDILEYMDSIGEQQKEVIDLTLKVMKDKLKNPDLFMNVKDVATVYGVIYDKALKSKELKIRQEESKNKNNNSDSINNNILNIANLINNPKPNRSEKDV